MSFDAREMLYVAHFRKLGISSFDKWGLLSEQEKEWWGNQLIKKRFVSVPSRSNWHTRHLKFKEGLETTIRNQDRKIMWEYSTGLTEEEKKFFEKEFQMNQTRNDKACAHAFRKGYTEDELEQAWSILLSEDNPIIRALAKVGRTWQDLPVHLIDDLIRLTRKDEASLQQSSFPRTQVEWNAEEEK